jgi:cysteine-rich repeat protein
MITPRYRHLANRTTGLSLVATALLLACGDDGGGNTNENSNNHNQTEALCGDGTTEGSEECDDGSANSDVAVDACRTDCTAHRCGDGVKDTDEVCDEGPANSDEVPDACRPDCTDPRCGDGVVDVVHGETCDFGEAGPSATCSATCQVIFCGNGTVDPGEVCDDGNNLPGDDCSPDCLSREVCGNGIVDAVKGEECDCGTDPAHLPGICTAVNGSGPAGTCRADCRVSRCGNGLIDPGEVCDDGNAVSGDGCSGDCLSRETCRNGRVDYTEGEQCDDGNAQDHDGCSSTCQAELPYWRRRWDPPSIAARTNASLAYDPERQRAVLFGGSDMNYHVMTDTWEYDGLNWWRIGDGGTKSPLDKDMMYWDPVGERLLRVGNDGYAALAVLAYDGAGWTELPTTGAPYRNGGVSIAYDSDRARLVVFGGYYYETENPTYEFDGQTWTTLNPVPSPPLRAWSSMTYDPVLGKVVLFGGHDGNVHLGDTWLWNGSTWTHVLPTTSPGARLGHSMAPVEGSTLLFGGRSPTGTLDDVWRFNGVTWTQLSRPFLPDPRQGHAMAPDLVNNRVLLFGGSSSSLSSRADLWEWRASDFAEVTPLEVPDPYSYYVMSCDPDRGHLTLFGDPDVLWQYDGQRWFRSRPATPLPLQVRGQQVIYDPQRSRHLLFGGRTPFGELSQETWVFDDVGGWAEQVTAHAPAPRDLHLMAYDSRRGRTLLFGGATDSESFQDTWEHDGTDWTEIETSVAPDARILSTMVYDERRDRLVLFGGFSATHIDLDDTWELVGTDWIQTTPASSPPARHAPMLTYDPRRGRVILFGGQQGDVITGAPADLVELGDTWEYDGTTWTPVVTAGIAPAARSFAAACYCPELRASLVFGGSPINAETWAIAWLGSTPHEVCTGGQDVDGDGRVGCDDPDCRFVAACHEDCGNGVDDNGNLLVDCEDAACDLEPACAEDCDNGVDDNGDGLVDCDDPRCDTQAVCAGT